MTTVTNADSASFACVRPFCPCVHPFFPRVNLLFVRIFSPFVDSFFHRCVSSLLLCAPFLCAPVCTQVHLCAPLLCAPFSTRVHPFFPMVQLLTRFASQPDRILLSPLAQSTIAAFASEAVSDGAAAFRSSVLMQLVAISSVPLTLLLGEKSDMCTTTRNCSSCFLQSPCLVLRWYIYYIHMYTIAELSASRDSVNVSPLLSVTLPPSTEVAVLFFSFLYIAYTVL